MKHIALSLAVLAAVCVSPLARAQEVYDPIEPVNRAVFGFNNALDTVVLDPAVIAYRAALPKPVRTGIKNFIRHLESPLYLANNLLQGDLKGAKVTLERTIINTFVGFGGLMDVAASEGIEADPEDFGQTLAVWGVGSGPYLVLPVLGPSNARDTAGLIVDSYADPLSRYADNIDKDEIAYARAAVKGLVLKNDFYDAQQDLKKNSADYYAAIRSAAKQRREADIRDQNKGAGNAPLDDYIVE